MDLKYAVTPFAAWVIAGSLKFLVNSVQLGQPAFSRIGYGGLPSNHSTIVSSMAALIALNQGIGNPAFGVALTLAFIVILDAHSLRHAVGDQARAINRLAAGDPGHAALRERMGHTRLEILAGLVLGVAVAWLVTAIL